MLIIFSEMNILIRYIIFMTAFLNSVKTFNQDKLKFTIGSGLHWRDYHPLILFSNSIPAVGDKSNSNFTRKEHFYKYNLAEFPPLSLTRRPVIPEPGGQIEKLKELYDNGLNTAISYLQAWPSQEKRIVDLFATTLEPKAAIVPGQKTYLTIPLEERGRIFNSFKSQKAAVIFIGWVENHVHHTSSSKHAEITRKPDQVNLVGYAAVATVNDFKLLDKNGEIGIEILGRCKIKRLIDLNDDNCQVEVIPHKDELKPFSNPELSRNYIRNIHSLFDRCNSAEADLREKTGKQEIAELVRLRPPLNEKVDELIYELDNPSEPQIAELLSFCAMDYHFDAKTRCWALEMQDTEARLSVINSVLEEKLKLIKAEMKTRN